MQNSLFESPAGPLELRPYQRAAVDSVYAYLRAHEDNPCVVVPTGGGKTPIIGTICRDAVTNWAGRVLILAHVKELLAQAADNLKRVCPRVPVGIYSAGLGRRDVRKPVTIAGIQSIYKIAYELDPFDLVLIDEAHLIQPEGDGMYRQFLADAKKANPALRIVGFTATPFRMKSGMICTPEGFLNSICYEIGVRELIVDGYLSPLITKNGRAKVDTSGLHVRAGEFVSEEVEALVDDDNVVVPACEEIAQRTADRKSCLVFTCSVKHGQHVCEVLNGLDPAAQNGDAQNKIAERFSLSPDIAWARFISGETASAERDRAVHDFREGRLKYLVNVNVFTTGFDAPNVDCVALMRPTNSPGLYYQMVGRGFRLFAGKPDCLVLDFGGNVKLHGPVDKITIKGMGGAKGKPGEAPAKECPNCQELIACGFSVCPVCGYEFPPPEREKHDAAATNAGILSGQVTVDAYPVSRVLYSRHVKRLDPDGPASLRVDYLIDDGSYGGCKSEWICLEHDGFARQKAEQWWRRRSPDPIPDTAERALEIAEGGGLAECSEITVRTTAGADFPERITGYVLGPKPEPLATYASAGGYELDPSDEIPF